MDELGDKHFSQIINFKEVKKRTMNNQRIIIRDFTEEDCKLFYTVLTNRPHSLFSNS